MLVSGLALISALTLRALGGPVDIIRILYIAGVLVGIYEPARSGWSTLRNLRELDMNALMVMAVIGATIIGEYNEALVVVFLFSLGNFLQAYTFDQTRNSIRKLMDLAPREATVRRGNSEVRLPVTSIVIGDTVVVKPGETIPVDGEVISGHSTVNQAAITGESVPVSKEADNEVFAGTLNEYGSLEILVNKSYQDTALSRIISMVEEAQAQRAPSQQLIDRFSRYYTPAVIGIAFLVAIVPTLFLNQSFDHWLYQALALLLVACPCALVISTPVSIVSAIGNAARQGVLIKGGSYLEELGQVSVVAFDKTGTLTEGRLEVTDIILLAASSQEELLAIAAAIESRSEHPVADAILRYTRKRNINVPPATDFKAVPGKGAQAQVNGIRYYAGNPSFLANRTNHNHDSITELQDQGKTVILIGDEGEVLGLIAVSDQIRPDSTVTVNELKNLGITQTIMLTGDNMRVAHQLARQVQIDEYHAELLPEQKLAVVEHLLDTKGRVAMVGDGINDAPALARATVGIAMGAAGTDVALETADVALMADDLSRLPFAIHLSRKTVKIIKENVIFSLIVKLAILMLVFPGLLTMWLAVIADVGTSLLVTFNGMRLLKVSAPTSK
ncbi:heavy metal translocating P-type ATPase [Syntrophomonas erecta]